jgi:hypothetical protein
VQQAQRSTHRGRSCWCETHHDEVREGSLWSRRGADGSDQGGQGQQHLRHRGWVSTKLKLNFADVHAHGGRLFRLLGLTAASIEMFLSAPIDFKTGHHIRPQLEGPGPPHDSK